MSRLKTFWWLPFGRVEEISPADLHAMLRSGDTPQILDVRSPKEWRAGHISGAVNIPITSFRSRLPELEIAKSRPIVTICLSAHRSIPAIRLLQNAGYPEVCQLQGGMRAWWAEELPTVVD
jgi:rhodanese-related sulfurtransferase